MSKYDDLVKKLKEIFQIDRPELDFGVYRILNARVGEINEYLEKRLKAKVSESLAVSGAANMESLQHELKEKEVQYRADGIDPATVPKVLELRKKLAAYGTGTSEHENAVFTHLLTFFSRYYDKGDFISQRRYKGDTYSIPYAGEEVVLHWANKDQYYTKSGENFANYAFKLDDGRSVRFSLVTADTAKDNRKDNDKERRFVLIEPHTRVLTDEEGEEYEEELLPVSEVNGELVLRFEYKSMPKGSKQEALVLDAVNKVLNDIIVKARWLDLSKREPTEKNPQRTLLEKCLTSYTNKNTADYFIHKDLGGFLRRELDFYIKNEVMYLDDVQNAEKFADIEKNLRMIQTMRAIGLDLITFLAQLEEFQKKLWLKKKFVVAAHYCITLDRIIKAAPNLLATIAVNEQQWDQWDNMGMLDCKKDDLFKQAKAGSVEYLKEHPYLMADTSLFDAAFKHALLSAVDNLDETLDGLLIHGDNFQALNLLQKRYREQVRSIYIDPPYNTDAAPIIYKNGFKVSTWNTLIQNRIDMAAGFLSEDGVLCATIDDFQQKELHTIIEQSLGTNSILGTVVIRNNPSGRPIPTGFAIAHEYAIFASMNPSMTIKKLDRTKLQNKRYKERDKIGNFMWELLRKRGSNSRRDDARRSYFPFYVSDNSIRIPTLAWEDATNEWIATEKPLSSEEVIYPIDEKGVERNWRWGLDTAIKNVNNLKVERKNSVIVVYYKFRQPEGATPTTNWIDSRYSATEHGTGLVKQFFQEYQPFSYPKSLYAVEDSISIAGMRMCIFGTCMDFFAGSGTTAHAIISLNRQDSGKRKYILVEQGEYFDTVLKPRIQKVVYSTDWKDGKSTSPKTGISHAFKVIKLESYEDTLNNLQLRRTPQQQSLLGTLPPSAKEDYLLRYLLDIESRGSLLSLAQFNKPFDCKLKVAVDSAGAYQERKIDLVETFNYLIGLRVKHVDFQQDKGFVSVTGWLPTGEKTLVLWRDTEQVDYDTLNRLCDKLAINPADSEYEVVYINGDHNIPAVFTSTEAEGGITKTLKIRQIEPEFLSRMFAVEGV
jgi:adenine-specific DNA-methyltransferase